MSRTRWHWKGSNGTSKNGTGPAQRIGVQPHRSDTLGKRSGWNRLSKSRRFCRREAASAGTPCWAAYVMPLHQMPDCLFMYRVYVLMMSYHSAYTKMGLSIPNSERSTVLDRCFGHGSWLPFDCDTTLWREPKSDPVRALRPVRAYCAHTRS